MKLDKLHLSTDKAIFRKVYATNTSLHGLHDTQVKEQKKGGGVCVCVQTKILGK